MQTQGRREGTSSDFLLHSVRPFSRRFVVVIAWFSARCFTQPTYLRALTYSGCAAASIYTYHTDPRWVCHIRCFVFRLLSLRAVGLFGGRLSSLCAFLASHVVVFFSFKSLFVFFLSVCHVAVLLPLLPLHLLLSFLLCSRCSGLSDPAQKRDHRPGDDISEIMSCFTRTPPPSLHPSLPLRGGKVRRRSFTNAIPSPVTHYRVAARWASLRSNKLSPSSRDENIQAIIMILISIHHRA